MVQLLYVSWNVSGAMLFYSSFFMEKKVLCNLKLIGFLHARRMQMSYEQTNKKTCIHIFSH